MQSDNKAAADFMDAAMGLGPARHGEYPKGLNFHGKDRKAPPPEQQAKEARAQDEKKRRARANAKAALRARRQFA